MRVLVEGEALVALVRDALDRYGEKLRIVLKTAIEIAKRNRATGNDRYGDFDHRTLVMELERKGFRYNPSQLLRILEREYNIIETSYKSSNQHWYRFKDLEAVERALGLLPETSIDDPDIALIRIQIKALGLRQKLEFLKKLQLKSRFSKTDIKKFQTFVFRELPKIVKLLKKAEEYEDVLYTEIAVMKNILELAMIIASRIEQLDTNGVEEVSSTIEAIASLR